MRRVIKDYLKQLSSQVNAKQIKEGTYDVAEAVVYKLLVPFFETKGIVKTSDIKVDTFKDYVVWRQQTARGRHGNLKNGEGVTALTLQKEILQIKKWVKSYLLPHKLINADLANDKQFIVYVCDANDEVVENYEKIFSPIETPSKKLIL